MELSGEGGRVSCGGSSGVATHLTGADVEEVVTERGGVAL